MHIDVPSNGCRDDVYDWCRYSTHANVAKKARKPLLRTLNLHSPALCRRPMYMRKQHSSLLMYPACVRLLQFDVCACFATCRLASSDDLKVVRRTTDSKFVGKPFSQHATRERLPRERTHCRHSHERSALAHNLSGWPSPAAELRTSASSSFPASCTVHSSFWVRLLPHNCHRQCQGDAVLLHV